MSNQHAIKALNTLLANTYALYLKTQNYHWHVKGPNFYSLHELFEGQYHNLATANDEIAERIITLGGQAAADFEAYQALNTLSKGDSSNSASDMLKDLVNDHHKILDILNNILSDSDDEASNALLSDRIAWHEKTTWMLSASI